MRYLYFCRYIFLPLFLSGVASSQIGPDGGGGIPPGACSVNTSSTPTLRYESLTEPIGDIVITCSGPISVASGQPLPQVNVTVSFSVAVTSRLLNGNVFEALLLIDEPNSGLASPVPGFGPQEPFTLCSTPLTRCAAWAQQVTAGSGTYAVAVNSPNASPIPANAAPNVYQGVVSGNQVTFFGVPVLKPGAGASRIFRITNVRINASQFNSFGAAYASFTVSDPASLPLNNQTPLVAFGPYASLNATAAAPAPMTTCNPQSLQQATILTYSEIGLPPPFKTRVDPTVAGQTSGQSASLVQDVPGTIHNTESDFTLSIPGGAPAGLADFGTRFKAVFRNVPAGVRLFVSAANVTANAGGTATGQVAQPAPSDAAAAFALVPSESSAFSVPAPNAQVPGSNINVVEITPAPGTSTATAVWEVVNANLSPSSIQSFQFAVFVSFPSNAAAGMATVNMSYAPTSTAGGASVSAAIPRFADTSTSVPAISLTSGCTTTTISLTASPNPSVYGQGITVTTTVPSGGTGTVSFFEDLNILIAGPVALNGNTAQSTVTSLPVGTDSLFAIYSGDSNFLPATSTHVPVVVNKAATTTVLTVSPDRSQVTATSTAVLRRLWLCMAGTSIVMSIPPMLQAFAPRG